MSIENECCEAKIQIEEALAGVSRLFLDTAPVIYFVERNPEFVDRVDPIFDRLEFLTDLEQVYLNVVTRGDVLFVEDTLAIAHEAARVRFKYNLQLPDALQIAAAIASNCEAFLTNDVQIKRVTELKVLVVSELEA